MKEKLLGTGLSDDFWILLQSTENGGENWTTRLHKSKTKSKTKPLCGIKKNHQSEEADYNWGQYLLITQFMVF